MTLTTFLFGSWGFGRALATVLAVEVNSPRDRIYTDYCDGYIRLEGRNFPVQLMDAHDWLLVDANVIFQLGVSRSRGTTSYLDIEVHDYDCSRLYLFPIAIFYSDELYYGNHDGFSLECLILRTISVDDTKFERLGLVAFKTRYNSTFAKEYEAISNFVLADDPL